MANYNSPAPRHSSDTVSKMFPTSHRGSHCYGKSWAKIKVVQRSSQVSVETWWSHTCLKGLIYLPPLASSLFHNIFSASSSGSAQTSCNWPRQWKVIEWRNEARDVGKKKKKEKKGLFSLGSRLKMEHISASDSKQNSTRVNELSHTLGSAEQGEGDLWFLLLTLLLHAAQAKLIYVALRAGLK